MHNQLKYHKCHWHSLEMHVILLHFWKLHGDTAMWGQAETQKLMVANESATYKKGVYKTF